MPPILPDALAAADKIAYLSRAGIFSGLGQGDLAKLADLAMPREYAGGEVVIHQGDFGDAIYFICRGGVDVFIRNREGAESVIGRLAEGDFFGEMALLTGAPRSASVRTSGDALLLWLDKKDFDVFLREHPEMALLFSRILAERITAANRLHERQIGREEQLKKLLFQEEEEHLTRLVGRTKQFQAVEKRVEELSGGAEPLVIVGPEGAAVEDVARLLHFRSPRSGRPFMVVDLGGGEEWRTYRARARGGQKDAEEEARLFEDYQVSTVFGHEGGAMRGTEASRLGCIELADGGTIVLKNVDRLAPGSRERLNIYLLEKKFYRLGGMGVLAADTRVIGTLTAPEGEENPAKVFRGRIPPILLRNRINLPPLSSRRRDIAVIAETYLEKHAALQGKEIKDISHQAVNTLVRYSWPGNDRELESVIERGVMVCEGDTLLAEHIFLGLTPYSEKGRANLLRLGPFRRAFANLRLRGLLQGAMVPALLAIIAVNLTGLAVRGVSVGTALFWYFMLPLLFLSFILLGRVYCSICPIHGLTRLLRLIGSGERPAPKVFGRIGVAGAAFFTIAFFWMEDAFLFRENPMRTAAFLIFLLVAAAAANFVFKQEVWCRFMCPMGYMSGTFACLAAVELRANNSVCSSQCKSALCFKGDGASPGCPMGLFPVSLTSNQNCKMCGTCVHNCPFNSIHLDLRWPGAEIWENREPALVTALTVPAMLGIVFPLLLHQNRHIGGGLAAYTLLFLAAPLALLGLFSLACLTGGRAEWPRQAAAFGFAYLPLAFAGHLACQFPYLLTGWRWLTGAPQAARYAAAGPRVLIVGVGLLWGAWAMRKLSPGRPRGALSAHGALMTAAGLGLLFLAAA